MATRYRGVLRPGTAISHPGRGDGDVDVGGAVFPHTVPLLVGTEQIREAALAAGHRRVTLLEPPVDTQADNPWVDGRSFRDQYGIEPDDVLVTMICRLVPELKLEGLLAACDAVGELASTGCKIRLVIVGDGRARSQVAERAARANQMAGGHVVRLAGEIADPRPAYAAADVVIGQGGSALRAMAFGKPLIVVGEGGFSELLTSASAPIFLHQGWYGVGPGSLGSGVPALRMALHSLCASPELRHELGAFARRLVTDRFSLQRAAQLQEEEYVKAMQDHIAAGPMFLDLSRSAAGLLGRKLRTKYQRWRGTAPVDDSNARPVVVARSASKGSKLDGKRKD